MVNKGNIRGNGRQLGHYLLRQGANERIRMLYVDGMENPIEQDLINLLRDMSLNEQLTRSRQGIYHAIVNPSPKDRELTEAEWLHAAEIMAEELGFVGQRHAVVLHEKMGRTHAHIAFERYKNGKMIAIDHNYRKHDKARARMEAVFQHTPTAQRNPRHAEMTATLTALWQQTESAQGFIQAARQRGFFIAKGEGRKPYLVVDAQRSFNLVRHLDGVKMKDVRERFKDSVLMDERKALAFSRTSQELGQKEAAQEQAARPKQAQQEQPQTKPKQSPEHAQDQEREEFLKYMQQIRQQQQKRRHGPRLR